MYSQRRRRQLESEGISIEQIEEMAYSYLTDMQNSSLTLR